MSKWRSAGLIALAGVCGAALAQERRRAEEPSRAIEQSARAGEQAGPAATVNERLCRIDIRGDKKDQWIRLPNAQSSVTQHRLNAGGKSFDYTATAGTLIIRDDEDKPIASIGYIAYTRHDLKGARPLMFAFNGGPGSSSLWLHMGVLGPKRVVVSDPGPTPAGPARPVDNEIGVPDKTDLGMIDPVGTAARHAHRARAVPHRSARLRHGPLHRSAPQGRCARRCRPRGRGAEDARVHRVVGRVSEGRQPARVGDCVRARAPEGAAQDPRPPRRALRRTDHGPAGEVHRL